MRRASSAASRAISSIATTASTTRTTTSPTLLAARPRGGRLAAGRLRLLDRARGDVDRQGEERGVEDEGHDAVGGDGAADLLVGDADVGHLRGHPDDEREIEQVPASGLRLAAPGGQATAEALRAA